MYTTRRPIRCKSTNPLCSLHPNPQEIGQSGMIKQGVYFNSNSLTGTLPTQLGNVNLYNNMKFHSNKLSGAIPTQVSEL